MPQSPLFTHPQILYTMTTLLFSSLGLLKSIQDMVMILVVLQRLLALFDGHVNFELAE
jgi:hypothetical protein